MGSVLSVFKNESNEATCDSRSTQTKMQQQSAPTGYPMPMMQGAPMMAQQPLVPMGAMGMPMYAGSAMGLPTNPPPELEGDKLTPQAIEVHEMLCQPVATSSKLVPR